MKKCINGQYIDMTNAEIKKLNSIPKSAQIESLKSELAKYDYIGVKIAMGVGTKEEYAKEIAYTEVLRRKIRALEE